MENDKHKLKKEEITKVAFKEWGKTCFFNMSLSLIANKMKITKASIYRYFKNKDELLESLVTYFFNGYWVNSKPFFEDSKSQNFEEFLYSYIKFHFYFYGKNPEFLYFFTSSTTKNAMFNNPDYKRIEIYERELMCNKIKEYNIPISHNEAEYYLRFIYGLGIFLTFYFLSLNEKKEMNPLSDFDVEKLINLTYEISLNGFRNGNISPNIDFEEIENHSSVKKEEIYERNKIFDAITSVVAEEGLWSASLDKIAKKAGMSKSSFYFHFKNKEEMFSDMVYKEITRIKDIFIEKQRKYNTFPEKLYCDMVVDATYMLKDLRIMHFFNWLHFQRLNTKLFKKNDKKYNEFLNEKYFFINEAIESNLIKNYSLDLKIISSLLNMQIVKEILVTTFIGSGFSFENLRYIFKYFLVGITRISTDYGEGISENLCKSALCHSTKN
ncbi:MAG: hypothetical protein A2086_13230 [Spirochaetes bacterium GWD1_27_9]|nr:MAG: hypothetical protein A2Z98_02210 [Spirochaetes bacterium GWB1_27_13]OHD25922.1 MAG: hypothetical protein A2Y34_14225 [Spirochaetes bacterium GWC1_27_15]OHD44887.1 MAG: hypothetical protein A2086_13230 [Spirochaetes bacterium GWD1_27_9]